MYAVIFGHEHPDCKNFFSAIWGVYTDGDAEDVNSDDEQSLVCLFFWKIKRETQGKHCVKKIIKEVNLI